MTKIARVLSVVRWAALLTQNIANAIGHTAAQIEGELVVRHTVDTRQEPLGSAADEQGWRPEHEFDDHPQVGHPLDD